MSLPRRLTWTQFTSRLSSNILLIDDPITFGFLPKESFLETYGPLMQTFDGKDGESYLDLYFEISVMNPSILVFIDEAARSDFIEEAVEMKLIPPLTQIMVGEDNNGRNKCFQPVNEEERAELEAIDREYDEQEEHQRKEQALQSKKAIEKQRMIREMKRLDTTRETQKDRREKKMILTATASLDKLMKKKQTLQDPTAQIALEQKINKITRMLVEMRPHSI